MLFLLSPAKTLDFETPMPPGFDDAPTEPPFPDRTAALIDVLRRRSERQIGTLMKLSPALAALNVRRYADWTATALPANSRPAAFAFDGAVYRGLDAPSLTADDLAWAQRHLVILSGLYGALRPLDRLQPYRLEMGTRLATRRGKDLYAYWGDAIAAHLSERSACDATPVIVNLASAEYFKAAARPRVLRPRVVDCVFEDGSASGYRVIGLHAKRARGLLARYAVQRRIATPEGLTGFDAEGYAFEAAVSSASRLVFRRAAAA